MIISDANTSLFNDNMNARITVPPINDGDSLSIAEIYRFYMTNDFGFSLGNDWQPLSNVISSQEAFGQINGVYNLVAALTDTPQANLESIHMAAASWKGSQIPVFTVNGMYVAIDEGANPVKFIGRLAAGALPKNVYGLSSSTNGIVKGVGDALTTVTRVGLDIADTVMGKFNDGKAKQMANKIVNSGLEAPNGYGLQGSTQDAESWMTPIPRTTYSLEIGTWFRADNLLINDISGISFTKEVIQDMNCPLAVSFTITFRPYKAITYTDFLEYFKMDTSTVSANAGIGYNYLSDQQEEE